MALILTSNSNKLNRCLSLYRGKARWESARGGRGRQGREGRRVGGERGLGVGAGAAVVSVVIAVLPAQRFCSVNPILDGRELTGEQVPSRAQKVAGL